MCCSDSFCIPLYLTPRVTADRQQQQQVAPSNVPVPMQTEGSRIPEALAAAGSIQHPSASDCGQCDSSSLKVSKTLGPVGLAALATRAYSFSSLALGRPVSLSGLGSLPSLSFCCLTSSPPGCTLELFSCLLLRQSQPPLCCLHPQRQVL